jgi:hypothetical protein
LVGRAGEQAKEVLEVMVASRAADQEDGGNLDLQGESVDWRVVQVWVQAGVAAQQCNDPPASHGKWHSGAASYL